MKWGESHPAVWLLVCVVVLLLSSCFLSFSASWACTSLAVSSLQSGMGTLCPTGRTSTPCSGPSSLFSRYKMENATTDGCFEAGKNWGCFPTHLTELSEAPCHGKKMSQNHKCRLRGALRLFSRLNQKPGEEGLPRQVALVFAGYGLGGWRDGMKRRRSGPFAVVFQQIMESGLWPTCAV